MRVEVADFVARFARFPCGAAVKSAAELDDAVGSHAGVVFLLRGDGLELAATVRRVHDAGKLAVVHIDLVDGLAADIAGVRWLARSGADAIISSHGQAVRAIRAEGLVAIQRLLCISQSAIEQGLAAVGRSQPHIVELLPGVILPDVADLVLPRLAVPLLAGGFVRSAEDVSRLVAAGALAVTTSEPALWNVAP
ncbi:MAG TPA: glycerol-3-phosphate responsive antiterminator [Candidatus Dormibacteraeota bacterium]|nr:glycerol-3-phosphate responsive antiterminator [Candidatus Dormibacteraeota bacterium]